MPAKTNTLYGELYNVSKVRNRDERVAKLKRISSPAIQSVLSLAFDERLVFLLPEGNDIPYKNNNVDAYGVFKNKVLKGKLIYFLKGSGYDDMKPMKREQIFISMLQGIHPDDAKLLISIKDKKLPFKEITKTIVMDAFPELTAEWTHPKSRKKTSNVKDIPA